MSPRPHPKIDYKNTVRILAYSSTLAVKQEGWSEGENGERDWGETLKIRDTTNRFFLSLVSRIHRACKSCTLRA